MDTSAHKRVPRGSQKGDDWSYVASSVSWLFGLPLPS
ncbi:unnamed protein product [Arabidopsis halleri]